MKQNFTVIALVLLLATVQCQFEFVSPLIEKFLNSFEQNNIEDLSSAFTYILEFDHPTEESIEASIQELNDNRNQIQNLEIQMPNCNQVVDLSQVQKMDNLESVTLVYVYGRCNLQGLKFLKKSDKLTRFTVNVLGTNDQNLEGLQIIEKIKSLQYINMKIRFSTFGVDTINLSRLENLEELHIDHEIVQEYNFSGLKSLRILDLQYRSCTFHSLDFLKTLDTSSNLKDLNLDYSYNKSRYLSNVNIVSHIAQITSLESLYLGFSSYEYYHMSGGMRRSSKIISEVEAMSDLNQLENLKSLKINISSNRITDFEPLVKGVFPLENLNTLDINCQYNKKSQEQFGIPNIKDIFDRQYSGKIENYKFK